MVSAKSVEQQFKRIHYNHLAWGRGEAAELPHILLEDETIFECVNGMYEGGFALLVATNVRLLLIDKKPLNFLTVEDVRYDMITELDYSHRLMGARISISAGSKNLQFRSYNQPRLRKLINHVQHSMAESKKKQSESQQDQGQHLAQINQQLQAYLVAQHQQQQQLQAQLQEAQKRGVPLAPDAIQPVKPSPELSDYLFAQSLLAQHQQLNPDFQPPALVAPITEPTPAPTPPLAAPTEAVERPQQSPPMNLSDMQTADLYAAGVQEIFGRQPAKTTSSVSMQTSLTPAQPQAQPFLYNPLEVSPLTIAYSKLPMALRNRKFGRPSFHAHSQAVTPVAVPQQVQPAT